MHQEEENIQEQIKTSNLNSPAPEKPSFTFEGSSHLLGRLQTFLPQLKAANDEIDHVKKTGNISALDIENISDDDEYIEMNLGLGVLQEKKPDRTIDIEDSSSEDDSSDDNQDDGILDKLLCRKKTDKPAIEDLMTINNQKKNSDDECTVDKKT